MNGKRGRIDGNSRLRILRECGTPNFKEIKRCSKQKETLKEGESASKSRKGQQRGLVTLPSHRS